MSNLVKSPASVWAQLHPGDEVARLTAYIICDSNRKMWMVRRPPPPPPSPNPNPNPQPHPCSLTDMQPGAVIS